MLGKTCRNGVLTDYQHGFSSKRSTETQLVYIIHDIASANQSNKTIYDAILDFSRAFEKVPHRRLLTKVDYYGIRGPLFNCFESFLTQRTQSVVIEGGIICSCSHDIRVPQGTVLGPLLFLRADVSKYRPEVYKSEKSKTLKKIHKVALGKLLT